MASEENFHKWTRPKLADYLKQRDFAASGLRKDDLVVLATKATELNVPLLEKDDTQECFDTFRTVDGHLICTEGKYSNNILSLPPVEISNVLTYLYRTCQWSDNRLKHHKKDDGYQLFNQQHIDKVQIMEVFKFVISSFI